MEQFAHLNSWQIYHTIPILFLVGSGTRNCGALDQACKKAVAFRSQEPMGPTITMTAFFLGRCSRKMFVGRLSTRYFRYIWDHQSRYSVDSGMDLDWETFKNLEVLYCQAIKMWSHSMRSSRQRICWQKDVGNSDQLLCVVKSNYICLFFWFRFVGGTCISWRSQSKFAF